MTIAQHFCLLLGESLNMSFFTLVLTALNIFNWCSELRETVEKQSEVIINIKVGQAKVFIKTTQYSSWQK